MRAYVNLHGGKQEKKHLLAIDEDRSLFASRNQTWRFWQQSLFQNCIPQLGFFLVISTGNWHLRMASIKQTVALFTAFDRPCYEKLTVQQLQVPNTSAEARRFLHRFQYAHTVAIDEAHEMIINKDCKEAITKRSTDYIRCAATFFQVCSKSLKNLDAQLFLEAQCHSTNDILTMTCATHDTIKQAANNQTQTTNLHLKATSQPNPKHHHILKKRCIS